MSRYTVSPVKDDALKRTAKSVAEAFGYAPEQAEEWLQEYLTRVRPVLVKGRHDRVFVNRLGSGLSRQGFWKKLRQYCRDGGLQS